MKIGESKYHAEQHNHSTYIPRSVRVALNLKHGDIIEYLVEDNKIILRKKANGEG